MSIAETGITVQEVERRQTCIIYHITTAFGGLETTYRTNCGWYQLVNLDVDPDHRRQGIGKGLLMTGLEHARKLNATKVIASIISRECLDAMTSVFGEEHIDICKKGDYAEPGTDSNHFDKTEAVLYLELS
jgi:GNAT superfamily N-acetyltransferase